MDTLSLLQARRLALARAGLLKPAWTGFPTRGTGSDRVVRAAAIEVVRRFGYLQLDTVSVSGARSHALVLMSRLRGFHPDTAESLLRPGAALFEYWGHEASWIPLELYPLFAFRRRAFRTHPWWGDVLGRHPELTRRLRRRIREEGPLRSIDMEGPGSRGWWDLKKTKLVATALWSKGELAIRERRNFQRSYDLTVRVIPAPVRRRRVGAASALATLLLKALDGHGWATTSTLAATWRLTNCRPAVRAALARLVERRDIVPCALIDDSGRRVGGWIRPADLELADRLRRVRPAQDKGVLLSPFDPLLWDRTRVRQLFAFDQVLEIFKPAAQRRYGYYCLPVLAGEHLVARADLKADRTRGRLEVLACHAERSDPAATRATTAALRRHAATLNLVIV